MPLVADNPTKSSRVFIAASRSDADEIGKTLNEHGMVPLTIEKDATPGTSWVASLHRCIEEADVVVGVMGDRKDEAQVFFELGVASALNKPAVLLIPPGYPYDFIPPSGIPHLRTDLRNPNSVIFGLEQIRSISQRDEDFSFKEGYQTRPIGALADQLIERLLQAGVGRESELVQIIYDAIRASGVSSMAMGVEAKDSGVDLAVWSNDLEPAIANPLLIECKDSLRSPTALNEVIGRMYRALEVIQNGCGFVIYRDSSPTVSKATPKSLPVIFISAEDFLNGLRDNGLASLVRKLRNSAAHAHGM